MGNAIGTRWHNKLQDTCSLLRLVGSLAVLLWTIANLPHLSRLACGQPNGARMLLNAAAVGDIDDVREALREGVYVDSTDNNGYTALMMTNDPAIAGCLLDHGANPNILCCHATPLIFAASIYNLPMAQILLDAGADPNLHEANFPSALETARNFGHGQMERLLLARGAREVVPKADGAD